MAFGESAVPEGLDVFNGEVPKLWNDINKTPS